MAKRRGNNRKYSIDEARAAVDQITPALIKKGWPATTSMLIPSMIHAARTLARDLKAQYKAERSAELRAEWQRLRELINASPYRAAS